MKEAQVLEKLKSGVKLFQYKSFAMSGTSIMKSTVIRGKDVISYKFEDGTRIHHLTGKSMLKKKLITPGDRTKTFGGWCTTMNLV